MDRQNTIKITDRGKSYEGLIKDISPSGVFFAAENNFEEGQILSFSVPAKNDKEIKISGQIVWADDHKKRPPPEHWLTVLGTLLSILSTSHR